MVSNGKPRPLSSTYRESQVLALIVVLRQLSSLDSQETTKQQQSAVKSQQRVQESWSTAVALVGDILRARFQIDNNVLQVWEEDEPEEHHGCLNADEDCNGLEECSVTNLMYVR